MQVEGAQKAQLCTDNKQRCRQTRQRARELALAINTTKRQIDALKPDAPGADRVCDYPFL